MIIDGRPVPSPGWIAVVDPATEDVVGRAPDAERAQLDDAVAAARRAWPSWRELSLDDRRAALREMAGVIEDNRSELARILTAEQGKPLVHAEREVMGARNNLLNAASLDPAPVVSEDSAEKRVVTDYIPLGVVAAIPPWNFPIHLVFGKIAFALMAGNTVVVKPSPFTPLATLRAVALLAEILPPGVLNAISGRDRIGPWLTSHPGVDKISFTGSTATGRAIMSSAAPTLKSLTMEMGGNDAAIVLPDVDIVETARDVFWAAFRNSGQICTATKRLYIHADIYEAFRDALFDYARGVVIGPGADPRSQLGPVQNRMQYDKVRAIIEDCRTRGITLLDAENAPVGGRGYFIPVMLADDPPDDALIVTEEVFGPVLPLLRFRDADEVVARANASDYGLGASIWGRDMAQVRALAARIQSGSVWINTIHQMNPQASFSGCRQSGIGMAGGLQGLLAYTDARTTVEWKGDPGAVWRSMPQPSTATSTQV
ncbi:MAG: aldehyde dehydrogenase family protein [Microbacterium sp.]